ncbi:MAG: UPF0175 family protein, partial [Clostridia bacterium]|nr:UPF0175 family protein [Clostridia bacterium]
MKEVVLRIPEEVRLAIGPGKDLAGELLKRIAVALYAEKKISMGKAVELSGLTYDRFMDLLGEVG